ncbi:MAG: hypothetical protein AVDCRST_MAG59-2433, partial [uncultured Thermomicrobiales bacterium]
CAAPSPSGWPATVVTSGTITTPWPPCRSRWWGCRAGRSPAATAGGPLARSSTTWPVSSGVSGCTPGGGPCGWRRTGCRSRRSRPRPGVRTTATTTAPAAAGSTPPPMHPIRRARR